MEFKIGGLYKAKKDFNLILTTPRQNLKKLPYKKINEGTIITFLKWDHAWLGTMNKKVKHFLIEEVSVFDSFSSFQQPEEYFEEFIIEET